MDSHVLARPLRLVAVLLSTSTPLAADEPVTPKWDFTNKAALAAKRRYDLAMDKIKGTYDKEATDAQKTLVNELKDALKESTKAGSLDEALKIRSAIEYLEKKEPLPGPATRPAAAGKFPTGKWNMVKAGGVYGTYSFRADGTVEWIERDRKAVGKMSVKDGLVVITYPDDRIERLTPSGSRLVVEHWFPSSGYPTAFPNFAFAEKAK
jgi:hypothetical protein